MKKLLLVATAALFALPTAAMASEQGTKGDCEQPPAEVAQDPCADVSVGIRIAERPRGDHDKTQAVEVIATNSAGVPAQLVVTYQSNRTNSQPRTIISVPVAGGGGYGATFDVPRWRFVDGQVVAKLYCSTHVPTTDLGLSLALA